MANSKNPKSFRLSDQALDNLDEITQISGVNQTAAVEIGIALLLSTLKGENREPKPKQPFQNVFEK